MALNFEETNKRRAWLFEGGENDRITMELYSL